MCKSDDPSAKWHELWIVHRSGCGRNTPKLPFCLDEKKHEAQVYRLNKFRAHCIAVQSRSRLESSEHGMEVMMLCRIARPAVA